MITPVLLCGGSGTRLWPLSRKSYPKQFARILGEESLFQAAARRLSGAGFAPPLVITGEDFRFIVTEQLAALRLDPGAVLIEPEGRNTAPAAALAALHRALDDPRGLVLLAPADHAIPDAAGFRATVEAGAEAARAGRIVTFGIHPTRAETGYGWLEPGAPGDGNGDGNGSGDGNGAQIRDLVRFVEKPDTAAAAAMLAGGRHLWNAGVFLARADVLISAFRQHAPDILTAVEAAFAARRPDLGFWRLGAAAWADVPARSIDHAVMEKAAGLSVLPYAGEWSDLGGWQSVWQESPRDGQGNALSARATAIDCENTLLRSESEEVELVGIGLKDVVAVAMHDAVLVADMSAAQEVREAVAILRARGAKQAEAFPRDHRPWGWFETLVLAPRFQVKRIHVHPGAALSLQSHVHRSEHWIVVEGTARVTVGEELRLLAENESVYIPLGARHRLENPGKVPMVLIEVQTGVYLGEDDITRYEDIYARG